MSTENENPSDTPTFDNLKKRVQEFLPQSSKTSSPSDSVCPECGSPLSADSKFCWMCGAATGQRSPAMPNRPSPPDTPPSATTSVRANDQFWASHGSLALSPSDYEPASKQQPFEQRRQYEPDSRRTVLEFAPRVSQDRIFDFDDLQEEQPADKKRSTVRTTAILVLLVVAAALVYWQKTNLKGLYIIARSAITHDVSSLFSDENATVSVHQVLPTPKTVIHRSRIRPQSPAPANHLSSLPPQLNESPLRVKVQGQNHKKMAASEGIYNTGIVSVGISDSSIATAKLSPMAVEISPRESLALLIKRVPPIYPEPARAAQIEGTVLLKVVIRKDGDVGNVQPISGNPLLIPAAMESVRQWTYKPYYRDGVPTEVETSVAVDFSLASQTATTVGR